MGMIEAKWSDKVREKPLGRRAIGVLGVDIGAGVFGGFAAEVGEVAAADFDVFVVGVGSGGCEEGSAVLTVGEGAEAIKGEGRVVMNFVISTPRSCQDWIV